VQGEVGTSLFRTRGKNGSQRKKKPRRVNESLLPLSFGKCNHRVALPELQLVGTAPCDGPLKEIATRLDVSNSPELFLAEVDIHWL